MKQICVHLIYTVLNFLIFMIIWDRERHLSVFSIHSGIQKAMLLQTSGVSFVMKPYFLRASSPTASTVQKMLRSASQSRSAILVAHRYSLFAFIGSLSSSQLPSIHTVNMARHLRRPYFSRLFFAEH